MKKINSTKLVFFSAFLLYTALFFTSCSKEGLQEFKENKDNTIAQPQKQVAPQAQATTANKGYTMTGSSWNQSVSFTTSYSIPVSFIASVTAGNKRGLGSLEFYLQSDGSLTPTYICSAKAGYGVGSITWAAQPGILYYIKINGGTSGWSGWMQKMELGTSYAITIPGTIPGTSAIVSVGVFPV